MQEERKLRFDKRPSNKGRTQEDLVRDWVGHDLVAMYIQQGERTTFPRSRFSQTLPEAARHLVNISFAQGMMPEKGTDYTNDIDFNAWRDAYQALGFSVLADMLESTRDIRSTHDKDDAGIKPTMEEQLRVQDICREISGFSHEVDAARFEYTLKHRAELEAISPTFKKIFELYDRRAIGLED